MNSFGWALIGPGKIAHRFAEAVQRMEGARLIAVHGRDPLRASAFAQTWSLYGAPVEVAGDIGSLFNDDRINAVYIATPHALHTNAIRQCLAAGKPVLCEKPLVPNHALGLDVVALARQHRVFLMEAVWTRFLPVYTVVGDWLRSGAIGRVRGIQSSFCIDVPFDAASRTHDPAQAGGALLDIGLYNLTMTHWALQAAMGQCPPLQSLHAHGMIGPSGVDHRVSATLEFADDVSSQFICAFDAIADNGFRIFGERGSICLPMQFWEATNAEIHIAGKDVVTVHRPFRINGFEGEIEEAMSAIGRGEIESPLMTHQDTLTTLAWMDGIRKIIGVRYPFE